MAEGEKNGKRLGAHIDFVDESGFVLIPGVRRTWAPRGETPIHHHRYRHDRISVLRQLLQHLRGHVIVIWDDGNIHKGDPVRDIYRAFPRLHLERPPPHAPELNPDEGVWTIAKRTLANARFDDIDELHGQLTSVLETRRESPRLLRAGITHSDLPLYLL